MSKTPPLDPLRGLIANYWNYSDPSDEFGRSIMIQIVRELCEIRKDLLILNEEISHSATDLEALILRCQLRLTEILGPPAGIPPEMWKNACQDDS